MSTANFYTMKNFPLFARDFDVEAKRCPECGGLHYNEEDTCMYCGSEYLEEGVFYDEIDAEVTCHEIEDRLDALNDDLIFHSVSIRSGYYCGVQFYVEEKDDPNDYDNTDCHYHFGFCRSVSIRKYKAEINKINRELKKLADEFFFEKYLCIGRFSNGEAIYQLVV